MTIAVQLNLDTGLHEIWAENFGFWAPGGPRLFRAPPHPNVKWEHADASAAERDAEAVRQYLARVGDKRQSKAELKKVNL